MLSYDVAGDGPDVVLLHPGIGDRRMWDCQWPWLTADHRTVRCDLRGFGQSPVPSEPYQSAGDVLELVDRLGIERAVLVGGSLGGRVALEVAVARPALVAGLVLVSPALPGHGWSEDVSSFGDAEDEALDAGDVDAAVELNLRMWFDGPGRTSAAVDPIRRASVAVMQRRAFELQRAADTEDMEELLVPDLPERLAEITVATVIIVGEHDASDFWAIGEQIAATLSNAQFHLLAGTAHVPYYERPEVFDPVLVTALDDLI